MCEKMPPTKEKMSPLTNVSLLSSNTLEEANFSTILLKPANSLKKFQELTSIK